MRKFGYILFAALFFAVCLIPSVGMLIVGESTSSANEVLAQRPQWTNPDGGFNREVLSDAADYFEDHFAFRQELITAGSAMKSALFHTSSQSQVALGKEGWLFYAETLDDFTGADVMTDRQAFCIARSLRLVQDYEAGLGRGFLFTTAPNKLSLYPQYGPSGLRRGDATSADKLEKELERQGVRYLDLFALFEEEDQVLYHRLDSHWTNKGAALAHDAFLEAFSLPGGDAFQKPGEFRQTHRGDLYAMLYPASGLLDSQWEFDEELSFTYDLPVRGPDDLRIQTTGGGENGNLLLFRDSFGNALHALLAESFGHALFSRSMPYDLGLADQVDADYVAVEIVERNLPLLSENAFVMPAPVAEDPGEARPSDAQIDWKSAESQKLPGFRELSGTVADECDGDSPVWLAFASGEVYELSPAGAGEPGQIPFTGYLPETAELVGARILYRQGDALLSADLS